MTDNKDLIERLRKCDEYHSGDDHEVFAEAADALEAMQTRVAELGSAVAEQAEDEGLWFIAETAPEAYLQNALRYLHALIEQDERALQALGENHDE